jgi:cell division protein FtsI (penicillin-binding protein 3)
MADHSGTFSIPSETLPEIDSTVPRFFGLSKKTLLPLLDRRDIQVEIRGDGWVKRQAPPPGTELTRNTLIILELE